MKKLLALLLLAPCVSFAQRLYLKPEISAGFGNIKASSLLHSKSVMAYKAGIGVGFELKRFSVETGIAYFKTGYKYDLSHLAFEDQFVPTPNADQLKSIEYRFNALLIPVKFGYAFSVGKFIRLVPEAGAVASITSDATARENIFQYRQSK